MIVLTIIALSSCFGNYCIASPSTGVSDSITISVLDIKTLNLKLVDYEFKKKQLELYKELANNYRITADTLNNRISILKNDIFMAKVNEEKQRTAKNIWRNIALASSCTVIIILLL